MKALLAVLLISALAGSAVAAWTDDFESYDPVGWDPLPLPWEDGSSQGADAGIGYGGSIGTQGPSQNWEWGRAYRPSDADSNVLAARFYGESTNGYPGCKVGLIGSKSASGNGSFGNADNMSIFMESNDTGGAGITLWGEDFAGGSWVTDNRVSTGLILSQDAWYDVRVTMDFSANPVEATGEYKESSSGTWIPMGTVTMYDDFDDTYVAVSAIRNGHVDDVGYTPEPISLVLLAAGGLLIRRKK